MNLPNTLTLGRIFLVPLLVVVLLTKFEAELVFGVPKEVLGAAIFALAAVTDWLDGYLARRRNEITQFGQMMDPLADKLLITAALVSLVQMGRAETWMVAIILGRELAVTVLRSLAHGRGVTMPASRLGKLKMVLQVVAVLLLILGNRVWLLDVLGQVALWLVLATAVTSAVRYYRHFRILAEPNLAEPNLAEPNLAEPNLAEPNVADFESARHRLVRDDRGGQREDERAGVGQDAAAG